MSSIKNGICVDCRHFCSGKINFYEPDTPRSCTIGNNEILDKFFLDCGHLTREKTKDYNVPCFEPTEMALKLQELCDLAGNILKDLKSLP